MFLDRDERLLLFHQRHNALPNAVESLKGFRDAGIKTVVCSGWTSWHEMEPSPGKYDWSIPDAIVETTRVAGLKILLPLYHRSPDWAKCIYYLSEGGGPLPVDSLWGIPWAGANPFDAETMGAELAFLHRACERYSAADVCCFYGMHSAGERVLPPGVRPYTEQDVVNVVLMRQCVFAQHSDELWNAFHPAAVRDGTGNEHLWAVFEALKQAFPWHTINRFVFTFFTSPGTEWHADIPSVKHWVGAEYCANVAKNALRVDEYGMWGMVVGISPDGIPVPDTATMEWVVERPARDPLPSEYDAVAEAIGSLR